MPILLFYAKHNTVLGPGELAVNSARLPPVIATCARPRRVAKKGMWKSPDYGPDGDWRTDAGAVALLAVVALAVWVARPVPKCWTLGADEISVEGGQATLDLRRIPKGECVTIEAGK